MAEVQTQELQASASMWLTLHCLPPCSFCSSDAHITCRAWGLNYACRTRSRAQPSGAERPAPQSSSGRVQSLCAHLESPPGVETLCKLNKEESVSSAAFAS